MTSDTTPLRYSHLWDSALEHAEELVTRSGTAAVIYYRPIDDHWFVLRADAAAPKGLTIRTTVHPGDPSSRRPDMVEHSFDRPPFAGAYT